MLVAAEVFCIAAALKADSKQSIQSDTFENQSRKCRTIANVYGCRAAQRTVTGTPKNENYIKFDKQLKQHFDLI